MTGASQNRVIIRAIRGETRWAARSFRASSRDCFDDVEIASLASFRTVATIRNTHVIALKKFARTVRVNRIAASALRQSCRPRLVYATYQNTSSKNPNGCVYRPIIKVLG